MQYKLVPVRTKVDIIEKIERKPKQKRSYENGHHQIS